MVFVDENLFSGAEVDDSRYWGIDDDFYVKVVLGKDLYSRFLQRGVVGTRHSMRDGSEIKIYDTSIMNNFDKLEIETLQFYVENKDRYMKLKE